MDNAVYTTLSRQAGLLQELQVLAHNVANASTAGYRREGLVFAEYIRGLGRDEDSLSMAAPIVRRIDLSQGVMKPTGGALDLAIQGPGFFQIEDPAGEPLLTRAGAFTANEAGEITAPDGRRLLDIGGAPVVVPPGARDLAVGRDGTVSADGAPIAQLALVVPEDPLTLSRRPDGRFAAGNVVPAEGAAVLQGFVETSNVNPVREITRLIEVQRAYEQGAGFLDREDERIRAAIRTLGQ